MAVAKSVNGDASCPSPSEVPSTATYHTGPLYLATAAASVEYSPSSPLVVAAVTRKNYSVLFTRPSALYTVSVVVPIESVQAGVNHLVIDI
ncbi:MAG: hypothetical protein H8E56_10970 [Candidatus Marinimicrobia bacterium]|nr:hypothetical protein [Candidatus Neomarinimicrobiota bacterium]